MTEKEITCPLCTSQATSINDHSLDRFRIKCPKCGKFNITSYALALLSLAAPAERESLIVKFDVFEEVYGKESMPTICADGNELEVRRE